jgi:hypothetical protein
MKGFQILLGSIVIAGGCLYVGLPYLAKQEELEVATAVAEAFLESLINKDATSSLGMASKRCQESLRSIPTDAKKLDLIPDDVRSWTFEGKYLSANKNQAILAGGLSVNEPRNSAARLARIGQKNLNLAALERRFYLILVKETDVWRVDVFTCDKGS